MSQKRWTWMWLFSLALVGLLSVGPVQASSLPQVMIILDGSGSMWAEMQGEKKIDIAKNVFAQVLPSISPDVEVGLTIYGHRRKGDCDDIEVVAAPGKMSRESLLQRVLSIQPKGKTPITGSLRMTLDLFKSHEAETTVVLISDGEETCHEDPCAAVKALKSSGIKFILHVIGFGVDAAQQKQLACLADAGGGQYFPADDVSGLLESMEAVKVEVTRKVEQAKAVATKVKTGLGKLHVTMPPSAVVSLAEINIQRASDGKRLKQVKDPSADSIHPLPSGAYAVILGFANPNYNPPTNVPVTRVEIAGGETSRLDLGAVAFNIAESLKKIPVVGVQVKNTTGDFSLELLYHGNDYYFFKTKPVPEGTYMISVTYANSKTPTVLADNVTVRAGRESIVTLDSGIQLLKPEGQSITGWHLIPTGEKAPLLAVQRRWDNEFPLWEPFSVPPGTYALEVLMKDMDAPLRVSEDIAVSPGQLVQLDTGL
ncbi:MAG: VWA domain-containing protein [Deltaproteobacteria bacterium]|nr:VWA domain-containing protein [Deltaproteobacteria bacterium]